MIKSATRIMLVDDHELVRSTFEDILNRIPGFGVVASAATPSAALRMGREVSCNLALIDINLGGELGTRLALDIRRLQPGIKTVFISANIYDRFVDHAIAMEADGFISKREGRAKFVSALQAIVNGRRFFSDEVLERMATCPRTGRMLDPLQSRRSTITPRQIQILKLLAVGQSKKQIAQQLGVAVKTVDCHCDAMMKRLNLHDRVALARYAVREGLVEP